MRQNCFLAIYRNKSDARERKTVGLSNETNFWLVWRTSSWDRPIGCPGLVNTFYAFKSRGRRHFHRNSRKKYLFMNICYPHVTSILGNFGLKFLFTFHDFSQRHCFYENDKNVLRFFTILCHFSFISFSDCSSYCHSLYC